MSDTYFRVIRLNKVSKNDIPLYRLMSIASSAFMILLSTRYLIMEIRNLFIVRRNIIELRGQAFELAFIICRDSFKDSLSTSSAMAVTMSETIIIVENLCATAIFATAERE